MVEIFVDVNMVIIAMDVRVYTYESKKLYTESPNNHNNFECFTTTQKNSEFFKFVKRFE